MATAIARELNAIRKSAEKMDAAAPAAIGTASAGDVVRQGDLYLVCLDAAPTGKVLKDKQLATGTSQGSRHVADGDCDVMEADATTMARRINALVRDAEVPAQLIGPAIVCRGETTITHPEHGHRTLPARSSWGCVYQRAFASEINRQVD